MDSSDQTLITALLKHEAYPHDTDSINIQETHISWVLLTGQYAYKIKKPVKFAFLDFSTLEKRHFFCQEELRLNRRLAPDLYLGLAPITGTPQHPRMDGAGIPIEYAVKMRQFPANQLLSGLAARKEITIEALEKLGKKIADFHLSMAKADESSPYGNTWSIKHWFDENFCCIKPLLTDPEQLREINGIQTWGEQEWQAKSVLIGQRQQQGFVRECHGDLHLGNITLIDGQPALFDCIEFNPELRWIDIINEMAFLVLDLLHYSCRHQAYWLLNRYLQLTGDYDGLGVLRFYLVYRAMVRAKLALLRGLQQNVPPARQMFADYQSYVDLAGQVTQPNRPALLITHGFSGSGKSYLASRLAAQLQAIQIRSDIERKRLFGYREEEATDGRIYSMEANARTYRKLEGLAKTILAAGYTVIVDAAFLKREERLQFQELAAACGVRFGIICVQAPVAVLRDRITNRKQDPSEATVEVLEKQLHSAEPLTAAELDRAITLQNGQQPVEQALGLIENWLRKAQ